MSEVIKEGEGRALFGGDARSYDAVRPPYPEQLYAFLQETGALRPEVATLELGAGNGLATRRLLALGAAPITALEPDARFAAMLEALAAAHPGRLIVLHTAFEEAALPPASYDLVAAATAFHWFDSAVRIAKAAEVLRPGGALALWWNVFGDPTQPDPFHDATQALLAPLSRSPSDPVQALPFALDTIARRQEILATGDFAEPEIFMLRWPLVLSAAQVGALYGTYSNINRLPPDRRRAILDELVAIAARDFDDQVTRNMVTVAYVARRLHRTRGMI